MQPLRPLIIILSLLISSISSAAVEKPHQLNTVQDALIEPKAKSSLPDGPKAGATNSEAISSLNTKFNDVEVPPMTELTGDDLEKTTRDGYWFIKHYSPYCGHCKEIAPTWQTLYEFYYTSNPVPGKAAEKDSMNSFTRYYDFHFASLDCVAYGDACSKHNIDAFPTFSIYKSGVLLKKFDSIKNMENLSQFVEEILETIRPGSRDKSGPKLPAVGASSVQGAKKITEKASEENKIKQKDSAEKPMKKQPEDDDDNEEPATKKSGSAMKSEKKQPPEKKTGKGADDDKTTSKSKGKSKDDASASDTAEASMPTEKAGKSKPVKVKAPPRRKKPSGPPNPTGNSVVLTQESFQNLVTSTQDPWFIKFYAPWCPHCQHMAPAWHQMAKELQNKLNIGEVNCDMESRLCKDVHVKAYPTIHFFRGGERVEYDGLRGLGDFVSFAKKAIDVGQGVQDVTADKFKEMEETEDVIFVYFYDHATTAEDFEALERLTLSLVGHAKLVKSNDTALCERFKVATWPRLMVSRSGRPNFFDVLAPKDMRDFRQVLTWMQRVWLPIVPELTASNSRDIMKGKYVVLGILTREHADDFELNKKEMKNAALEWMEKQTAQFELERKELRDAKQLRLEEAEDRNDEGAKRRAKQIHIDIREDDKKQVGFAWVDGVFWDRWIRTTYGINVKDGERVIISDEDNRRYWDETISGAPITPSRTSILETIPKVISSPPKISSKSSTGMIQRIFFGFSGLLAGHPYWSGILIAAAAIVGYMNYGKPARGRRRGISLAGARGAFLGLDEKAGLGGVGNGKAD